jgi:hypothetical protein
MGVDSRADRREDGTNLVGSFRGRASGFFQLLFDELDLGLNVSLQSCDCVVHAGKLLEEAVREGVNELVWVGSGRYLNETHTLKARIECRMALISVCSR